MMKCEVCRSRAVWVMGHPYKKEQTFLSCDKHDERVEKLIEGEHHWKERL